MNRQKVVNAGPVDRRGERLHWLYGINAVARRLAVQPTSIRALELLRGESARRAELAQAAQQAGIPVRDADQATLRRLTGCETHQGVAALAEAYRYQDLDAVVTARAGPVLVLDQIQDPHNLGALVRTAAAVGMAAVVIPRHGAAGVSPAVEKVAAGAVNDVPICQAANIRTSLLGLRDRGYWSIALTAHAAQSLFALEIPARPVLVLGGETGIRPLVDRTCDLRAAIPIQSGVESLNASVAGAVAMYEVWRRMQRLDSPGEHW